MTRVVEILGVGIQAAAGASNMSDQFSVPTYDQLKERLASKENQLQLQANMSQMLNHEARSYEKRVEHLEAELKRAQSANSSLEWHKVQAEAAKAVLREFYGHTETCCEDEFGGCTACDGLNSFAHGVADMLFEIRRLQSLLDAPEQAKNLARAIAAEERVEHLEKLRSPDGAGEAASGRLSDLRLMLEGALKTLSQVERGGY